MAAHPKTAYLIVTLVLALVAPACGGSDVSDSAGVTSLSESVAEPTGTVSEPDNALQVSTAGWTTDFERHTVPLSDIESGGPGKDGIPALDEPRFEEVAQARRWLGEEEPVIELAVGEEVRAYPLQILVWHEIVNDRVGDRPVLVTFCPLCNTALAFDRRLGSRVLDFGTTGNLRSSDLVMYDRQTESWWQQFGGEAIVGELAGETLVPIPARIVAWSDFAGRHPGGKVLSRSTGHRRAYGENPYTGYDDVDSPPLFPVANADDDRLPPKERVAFVERDGEAAVVPFSIVEQARVVEFEVAGERLEAVWLPGVRSALDASSVADGRASGSVLVRSREGGGPVVFDTPFWFTVAAFRPDVTIVGAAG